MTTRSKAIIFKPKRRADLAHIDTHGIFSALYASADPKGFKTAAQHPTWMKAMQQEMDALHVNNTWTLVPRPTNHNVVGCKWLFLTKYHADGSIERHKARLVAQGYSQIPGLDYSQSFRWRLPPIQSGDQIDYKNIPRCRHCFFFGKRIR